MSVRDLVSWGRKTPATTPRELDHPFFSLQREVNRLFDDMFRGFDLNLPAARSVFSSNWPRLEVSDQDKAVLVTAELPGMEEKDVELLLEDGVLTVRGEKRAEQQDEGRQFSERFYGRFERRIALGYDIEEDKVEASFRNGVLTVTLPKSSTPKPQAKRIPLSH